MRTLQLNGFKPIIDSSALNFLLIQNMNRQTANFRRHDGKTCHAKKTHLETNVLLYPSIWVCGKEPKYTKNTCWHDYAYLLLYSLTTMKVLSCVFVANLANRLRRIRKSHNILL